MIPNMDRNRLKEIHQSDLTESRLNEDFVTWLKTSGPTYLLIILVALCSYVLWIRWQEQKQNYVYEAWQAYQESLASGLPSSLEDVAMQYDDVGAIPHLSRMFAATILLSAVNTNTPLSADGTQTTTLTDEERTQYLDRADKLYQTIIESDDHDLPLTLLVVNAHNGRAAIAESRGDTEQARAYLTAAAERVEPYYPKLAEQARGRIETADLVATEISLITVQQMQALLTASTTNSLEPISINRAFEEFISPDLDKP